MCSFLESNRTKINNNLLIGTRKTLRSESENRNCSIYNDACERSELFNEVN